MSRIRITLDESSKIMDFGSFRLMERFITIGRSIKNCPAVCKSQSARSTAMRSPIFWVSSSHSFKNLDLFFCKSMLSNVLRCGSERFATQLKASSQEIGFSRKKTQNMTGFVTFVITKEFKPIRRASKALWGGSNLIFCASLRLKNISTQKRMMHARFIVFGEKF